MVDDEVDVNTLKLYVPNQDEPYAKYLNIKDWQMGFLDMARRIYTSPKFDEATMACFSRYACYLLSFNPKKPTGKFHFKLYMLCCAHTNLTCKIRIHTRDGADGESSTKHLKHWTMT
jgi:hypothetical protein